MSDGRLASHGTQCPFTLATHKWAPGPLTKTRCCSSGRLTYVMVGRSTYEFEQIHLSWPPDPVKRIKVHMEIPTRRFGRALGIWFVQKDVWGVAPMSAKTDWDPDTWFDGQTLKFTDINRERVTLHSVHRIWQSR